MIIEYKDFSAGLNKATSGTPYLNENYPSARVGGLSTRPYDYAKILTYIKRSPECLGLFNTIITDIVSDGVYFEPHKKQGAKSNIQKAEDFWRDQHCKEEIKATSLDWLMFGNGAIYTGLTKGEMKETLAENGIELKEEDYSPNRKFRHIAWSTMRIEHDSINVTGFTQLSTTGGPIVDTAGREIPGKAQATGYVLRQWEPEQIIHSMFMKMDGKVYGFTPTIAIMPEVSTLQLIKDYAGNFFENSGIPDWMFIFPKEMAGSPNITELEQKIKIWQSSAEKHRSMVFAGEVNPVELNKFGKDMEFRKLAVYYSSVLAFAFGMPLGKMQSILGMEIKAKESDLADSSYWRNIAEAQDYWEQLLNTQFWIPNFNVEMRFNRSYLQDEIRDAQKNMFIADYLSKMQGFGYEPTLKYINRILKLKDGDIKKMPKENLQMGPGTNRQDQMPNQSLLKNEALGKQKKNEQMAKAESRKIRGDLK